MKDLKTYQQLFLYIVPTITNIGFINILVVVVRLWWFRKHLKKLGMENGNPHVGESEKGRMNPADLTCFGFEKPPSSFGQSIVESRMMMLRRMATVMSS